MADTPAPESTIADPAPLGLAGFAATTFALSIVNAGLLPKSAEPLVIPLALFYGGLAQLLAAMWEFRRGNTFGATAFGTFGPFWMAFALYAWLFLPKIPEAQQATATGVFLLVFTIFTALLMIAAVKTNGALLVVFILLFLAFLFLTIGELAGAEGIGTVGGWIGMLTAVVAWYTSFAIVLNSTAKRTILPLFAKA